MSMDFRLLKVGSKVRSRFELNKARIQHWRYGRECADIGGGLMPNAIFEISEMGHVPTKWAKLAIPGRSPVAHLKLSAEELASGFDIVS
jgi:hypothetical protein